MNAVMTATMADQLLVINVIAPNIIPMMTPPFSPIDFAAVLPSQPILHVTFRNIPLIADGDGGAWTLLRVRSQILLHFFGTEALQFLQPSWAIFGTPIALLVSEAPRHVTSTYRCWSIPPATGRASAVAA
jgi:hypothetical protein